MDLTAELRLLPLHARASSIAASTASPRSSRWAVRIRAWRDGRPVRDGPFIGPRGQAHAADVFVYFDTPTNSRQPHDARAADAPFCRGVKPCRPASQLQRVAPGGGILHALPLYRHSYTDVVW